jgi:hypothetical protein
MHIQTVQVECFVCTPSMSLEQQIVAPFLKIGVYFYLDVFSAHRKAGRDCLCLGGMRVSRWGGVDKGGGLCIGN